MVKWCVHFHGSCSSYSSIVRSEEVPRHLNTLSRSAGYRLQKLRLKDAKAEWLSLILMTYHYWTKDIPEQPIITIKTLNFLLDNWWSVGYQLKSIALLILNATLLLFCNIKYIVVVSLWYRSINIPERFGYSACRFFPSPSKHNRHLNRNL